MMKLAAVLSCMATLAGLSATQAAEKKAALDAVAVRLVLENTGELSPDVTSISDFKAWNGSPVGAGIAGDEMFDAILIQVRFTSDGEIFAKGRQATVTVRHARTRKLILRRHVGDVYVGTNGKTVKSIFLDGHSCTPLTIAVTGGGGRTIAKSLDFECGE